ncbi:MAG: hypothetical protein JNK60_07590 [Acidobacteria bacterium]|nr:hypothetical protein [Acidobacteriota bacterium]
MKKFTVIGLGLLAFCVSTPVLAQKPTVGRSIKATLVSPKTAEPLRGGTTVDLVWDLQIPSNLMPPDIRWCEQEIFATLGDGSIIAVTPRLDPTVRKFAWRVPNLNSSNVVVDLRFGCDADPVVYERSHPQVQRPLTLVADPALQSVAIVPGEDSALSWESTVSGVKEYDVQVSFDGGTTFTSAGRTSETSFAVSRPDGFHGRAQFRVVAVRADGSEVASPAVVEARPGARLPEVLEQ